MTLIICVLIVVHISIMIKAVILTITTDIINMLLILARNLIMITVMHGNNDNPQD